MREIPSEASTHPLHHFFRCFLDAFWRCAAKRILLRENRLERDCIFLRELVDGGEVAADALVRLAKRGALLRHRIGDSSREKQRTLRRGTHPIAIQFQSSDQRGQYGK